MTVKGARLLGFRYRLQVYPGNGWPPRNDLPIALPQGLTPRHAVRTATLIRGMTGLSWPASPDSGLGRKHSSGESSSRRQRRHCAP